MFERYTEKARRAIFFARFESSQVGSPVIATDHLLLGVLRESKQLQPLLKVDIGKLGEIVRSRVVGVKSSTSVDIPLDDSSKRALDHAAEEADAMQHDRISPQHLLLGIMRQENARGAQILRELGAPSIEEVRKAIAEVGPSKANDSESPVYNLLWGPPIRFVDEQSGVTLAADVRSRATPRIGEAVVLQRKGASEVYRVTDVRWTFSDAPQAGEPAQTTVEVRVRKEPARE